MYGCYLVSYISDETENMKKLIRMIVLICIMFLVISCDESIYHDTVGGGYDVVCFGDSILGNIPNEEPSNISNVVADKTQLKVLNAGFGGCQMSEHAREWDTLSFYNLSACIEKDSFITITSVIPTWHDMPSYFPSKVDQLETVDFRKVNVVTVSYGTNDYREGDELDNEIDPYDTKTVCGALRVGVEHLRSVNPNLIIIVTTPIYRWFMDESFEYVCDSDIKDWGGGTLIDYNEALIRTCKELGVVCLDLYNGTGINRSNYKDFFDYEDGTHPNAAGRVLIGELIADAINSNWH